MKNNLMIKKYNVEYDNGTKNMKTVKSFFGTKLINIENNIIIDNNSIQYTDFDGYQNYNIDNVRTNETEILIDLTDIKSENHIMNTQTQDIFTMENNTKWEIVINIKKILREYLFAKIKESRTFKTLNAINTKSNDINLSIYDFINLNVINKYELSNIDLYLRYESLNTNNIFNTDLVQYDPVFDETLYDNINLITDYTLIKNDQFENLKPVQILYNQIKKSNEYRFNYYFNLNFERI